MFAVVYPSLDHHIYWLGGGALTDGAALYERRHEGLWFTNTPFMALVFAPMSLLPLTLARVGWQLASAGAFAWACASGLRLAGRTPHRAAVAALFAGGMLLEPVWHTLFLGQVNLFLLALVLHDLRRVADGRSAGVGVGIAAAVKLTPAIFVVLLLAAGRVRAAATATGVFLLGTGAAWLVAPEASRTYWFDTFYDTSRVGVPYISNQSPIGAAARVLDGVAHIPSWYRLVPLLLGLAGIVAAVAWARRGDWLAAAAVTGVTGLLVSPVSWTHHWVWALPALLVFARSRALLAAGTLPFLLAVPWLTPRGGGPDQYGLHGLTTVAANAYLVAALVFLAYMTITLHNRPIPTQMTYRASFNRSDLSAEIHKVQVRTPHHR
ncbi:glycosyltransferase 87 family protein [Actinocorallia sp. A-T 12471]|uniref:glycosyltransferase 87 family protein n=1 Tax=Actinocorallia sp. A-T 12471 TaxID=3089813 RepID=UPI0029CC3B28|nr:glycosyltransferase 87 family protein [Actinocorallia sp. A-T 12471]MDX6741318.1 glycosyltransferase 87 family protein [Actinocorallia sp. A-T 12471]